MQDDPDPYRPPEAPIDAAPNLDDPGPRTTLRFSVAVIHFGLAALVLSFWALFVWATIDLWLRAGTKWENHPTRLGIRELMLVTVGCSGLGFLLAGRSFGKGRKDAGVGRSAAAFVFLGLTILAAWWMPRPR